MKSFTDSVWNRVWHIASAKSNATYEGSSLTAHLTALSSKEYFLSGLCVEAFITPKFVNATNTQRRNGNPLQYSCLENPRDGGAWQATVHGVTKSWTQLNNFTSPHLRFCHR